MISSKGKSLVCIVEKTEKGTIVSNYYHAVTKRQLFRCLDY